MLMTRLAAADPVSEISGIVRVNLPGLEEVC
jgi:hypothetical protein